jgi:PAS domain S-box-containing protein
MDFLLNLFSADGFTPRWHCGTAWTTEHGWLHILADQATCWAYFAVPVVVAYHVMGRRNTRFRRSFWIFFALIFLSCGSVHLVESLMFWWPAYRLSALLKLITATASCAGVLVLARAMPRALSLRTPEELARVDAAREDAEASLEHERNLLHAILDHLPDPIYFKDRDGKFERISRSLAARLGLSSPADAVGKSDADFFPRAYAEAAAADERELLRGGKPLLGKEENPTWPDGRSSWVLTTKVPSYDRHGRIVGSFGISHDVTRLKETEQALRNSEQRFELALRGAADGLWDWDVQTDAVYYSPRFKQLLGYRPEEFADNFEQWKVTVHPDDLYATLQAIDRHLNERVPYEVEYRLRTKTGAFRWFRACGQAVWDETGKATRMAGSLSDITDRRTAEEELQASQRLYLSLVENLPVHLFRKDLQGRFTFANQAFCRLLGRPQHEILGTTDFDYYPQDLAEKYRHDDEWVVTTGRLFEDIEENADGEALRFVEVIKTPVHDAAGRIDGIQAIFWDVTDRKQAELALQEAKESAEAASRAKSEFLANMSHEIRTPMNAIIGMTELALETDLAPNQRECLETVLEAGESLLVIINQILDFSKIESGRIELDTVSFELREVLGATMKSFGLRPHRKGLELAWRVAEEVPDRLIGDPTRLRQIIVNLVGNAIKFTEHGEVVLSVTQVVLAGGQIELMFAVSDTGIGIPADKVDVIFDEFQQADTSTTRRFGGTGLGLAICSRLAHLMGGRIWVESQVGQGSTFYFTVRVQPDVEARPETVIEPAAIEGRAVLVVDDNTTNRRILNDILSGWGMQVECLASGPQALEHLRSRRESGKPMPLLITDVDMPEMDGFALAESIRSEPSLRETIIVMLTSRGSGDLAVYARLGVAAHLVKPVKQSELFDAVARACGAEVPRATVDQADSTAGMRPLSILLAEDGIANQKLAIGVLTKWGHSVEVAEDGKQAIRAWEQGDFDLVLMDVQMPEMDGLEATRQIRDRERGTGQHTAIVAMTAHAMTGDREKCLAAGMDGYVSKPVRKQELYEAIVPLIPGVERAEPNSPDGESGEQEATMTLDLTTALDATDGDVDLLKEVIRAFLDEAPQLAAELEQAVHAGDGDTVQRAAHTIKGAVRLFPDCPVRDAAENLEQMGRDQDLAQAEAALTRLKARLDDLLAQMRSFLA